MDFQFTSHAKNTFTHESDVDDNNDDDDDGVKR